MILINIISSQNAKGLMKYILKTGVIVDQLFQWCTAVQYFCAHEQVSSNKI